MSIENIFEILNDGFSLERLLSNTDGNRPDKKNPNLLTWKTVGPTFKYLESGDQMFKIAFGRDLTTKTIASFSKGFRDNTNFMADTYSMYQEFVDKVLDYGSPKELLSNLTKFASLHLNAND